MNEQVFLGIKDGVACLTKAAATDAIAASDVARAQLAKQLNGNVDTLYLVTQIPLKAGESFKLNKV